MPGEPGFRAGDHGSRRHERLLADKDENGKRIAYCVLRNASCVSRLGFTQYEIRNTSLVTSANVVAKAFSPATPMFIFKAGRRKLAPVLFFRPISLYLNAIHPTTTPF